MRDFCGLESVSAENLSRLARQRGLSARARLRGENRVRAAHWLVRTQQASADLDGIDPLEHCGFAPCQFSEQLKKLRARISTDVDGDQDPMSAAKQEVEALLRKLPDECTLEDIQYHLYVIEKVRRGIEVAGRHGAVSQEDAEQRLAKWTTE